MTPAARNWLLRIELRIGQMYGMALTEVENRRVKLQPVHAGEDAWLIGMLRTWTQVRTLRETGHLVRFEGGEHVQHLPAA